MLNAKRHGEKAEQELLDYLVNTVGLAASKNLVYSLRYSHDIEVDLSSSTHPNAQKIGFFLTFEVKNDMMAIQTGNVALEHRNCKKNEPSGITATTATFWAHKIEGTIWIVSVAKLKAFVETTTPFKKVTRGGDKNSDMYLYKITDFTSICKPLQEFKHEKDFLDLL